MLIAVALLSMAASAAACGQSSTASKDAAPVAGSFVGQAAGGTTFVAVVADPAGGPGQKRRVRLYACDGR